MKYIIFFLIVSFFISCQNPESQVSEEKTINENLVQLTQEQLTNLSIEIGKPQYREFGKVLKVNGKVEPPPQNVITIHVPLGGFVKAISLIPGMSVKKGQVIAILEDPQFVQLQQEYLSTAVKLEFAQKEYQRQKELFARQAVSEKQFLSAEMERKSLEVQKKSLAEKLQLLYIEPQTLTPNQISRQITIKSSVDGFVTSVNANVGKYLSPSEVLCELVDPSDMHFTLQVYEKDLPFLHKGLKIKAFINENPQQVYSGEIILVGKKMNEMGYTEVHCHFSDPNLNIVSGTFMNAEIHLPNQKTLGIPEESVVFFEGKHFIFVPKSKNQFEMKEVEISNQYQNFVEVKNLSADAELVTKGAYALLMTLKNSPEE